MTKRHYEIATLYGLVFLNGQRVKPTKIYADLAGFDEDEARVQIELAGTYNKPKGILVFDPNVQEDRALVAAILSPLVAAHIRPNDAAVLMDHVIPKIKDDLAPGVLGILEKRSKNPPEHVGRHAVGNPRSMARLSGHKHG